MASLAVAPRGMVLLLLPLRLLPGGRKSWLVADLAVPESSSADRCGGRLPGTFLTYWCALEKIHRPLFIPEGNRRPSRGKVN